MFAAAAGISHKVLNCCRLQLHKLPLMHTGITLCSIDVVNTTAVVDVMTFTASIFLSVQGGAPLRKCCSSVFLGQPVQE
jgi:hypothetical protein